ncbi:hypothetical protein KI387_024117, partial [Taxus chinensis]
MDPKTKKVYTSRDVEFFEKKEEKTPSDSRDVDFSPVVKIEANITSEDESNDGDD